MSALSIADTAIRQDEAGRYCLNDLHRAAGAEAKHQPANWLRMQQTQELVAELDRDSIPQIRGIESKQGLGTFVAKELVYAYAMWISPAFHLKVIRAYDSQVARPSGLNAGNLTRLEVLQIAMQAEEGRIKAEGEKAVVEARLAIASPKADALDRISASDEDMTITQASKLLDGGRKNLTNWMHAEGWIFRQNESWVAYQKHISNGNLRYKEAKYTDQSTGQHCVRPYCHVTSKGLARLAKEFAAKEAA